MILELLSVLIIAAIVFFCIFTMCEGTLYLKGEEFLSFKKKKSTAEMKAEKKEEMKAEKKEENPTFNPQDLPLCEEELEYSLKYQGDANKKV